MDGMEERLSKLEKQVRVYRALTIGISVVLVLFFGWLAYTMVTNLDIRQPIRPAMGHGLILLDEKGHAHASLSATRTGVIHITPEKWSFTSGETRSSKEKASITLDVSGDTPALTLTDADGKDVWHAP